MNKICFFLCRFGSLFDLELGGVGFFNSCCYCCGGISLFSFYV